jgi:hypothetical protein
MLLEHANARSGTTKISHLRRSTRSYFATPVRVAFAFCTHIERRNPREFLPFPPSETGTVVAKDIQSFSHAEKNMRPSIQFSPDRHVFHSINIRQIDQLDRWCRAFGVTRHQLTAAVSIVGANPDLVRRYLRFQNSCRA